MRRWYQAVLIKGVDQVFEDYNRKNSRFWNEGKWHNFIAPLLNKERQTFIEIGCNAGLFLKMAVDDGFKRVVGVEGNRRIMDQAKQFRAHNKGAYRLVHQTVGKNLVLDDLPVSDVVLMANTHYYFSVGGFSKLVDRLKGRTLYCIIVSAKTRRRQGHALYDLNSVRGYFDDWTEIGIIENIGSESDCGYRPQMYGVLFKGNLSTLDVNARYDSWFEAAKSVEHRSHNLAPTMRDFFARVLGGEKVEYENTDFYHYWIERIGERKSPEWVKNLLVRKASLAKDIQENGMKEPIYINRDGMFLDGIHRLCIAKLLNYKHILTRVV